MIVLLQSDTTDSIVQFVAPMFAAIPEPLQEQPFAMWRAEPELDAEGKQKCKLNGNLKFKKAPRNGAGYNISKTKPEQWMSFDAAVTAFNQEFFTGIGVLLNAGSGLVGIDLDDVDDLVAVQPEVQLLLNQAQQHQIYCEHSPSRTGLRMFVYGQLPENAGKRHGGVELYADTAFLTVTGCSVWPGEIKPAQWLVDALLNLISGNRDLAVTPSPAAGITPVTADLDLAEVLKNWAEHQHPQLWQGQWATASSLLGKVYPSQSEADMALIGHLVREAYRRGASDEQIVAVSVWEAFRRSGLYRPGKERQITQHAIPKVIRSASPGKPLASTFTIDDTYGDVLNGRAFATIWRNKFVFVANAGKWLKWQED